jgi:hypothetical protein
VLVVRPGHVDCGGQSHIFWLLFHWRPAGHCLTTGSPLPSGWGTHWIYVLQLSGFGYKQSFDPLHPVFLISSLEQTKFCTSESTIAFIIEKWKFFNKYNKLSIFNLINSQPAVFHCMEVEIIKIIAKFNLL